MYTRYEETSFAELIKRVENLIESKFQELYDRLENGITQDNLIDIKEAGRILGVSRVTIYHWIRDNKIKYLKKGNRYFFNALYVNNIHSLRKSNASTNSMTRLILGI